MVQDMFFGSDAQHILSIPLSRSLPEDKLICDHEKEGVYSTKSAYQFLSKQHIHHKPGPSVAANNLMWKKLWRTLIQEKIKNFMWRLLMNILPTRQNLGKKGIIVDLSCPFCQSCTQNINHIFIECVFAKKEFFLFP